MAAQQTRNKSKLESLQQNYNTFYNDPQKSFQ